MGRFFFEAGYEAFGWDKYPDSGLRWYYLVLEIKKFERETGKELPQAWAKVNGGIYEVARSYFNNLAEAWGWDRPQYKPCWHAKDRF